MPQFNIAEAKAHLSELTRKAVAGEEIIIARAKDGGHHLAGRCQQGAQSPRGTPRRFFCCRKAAGRNFTRTVGSHSGGFGFVNESAPVTLVDQGGGRCP